MAIKTFTKEYLMKELGLPYGGALISYRIVDRTRWSLAYEIIFQDPSDEKYYLTYYDEGATEMQDKAPWEYEDKIKATEVHHVQKLMDVWEPVE